MWDFNETTLEPTLDFNDTTLDFNETTEEPTEEPTTAKPTTAKPTIVPTTKYVDPCSKYGGECKGCVAETDCLWCVSDSICFNSDPDKMERRRRLPYVCSGTVT